MEVCNASHYDGSTAVAEAVSMAYANFRGKRLKVSSRPHCTRSTARTSAPITRAII
jgi:glycine cleavage system pyridoxal-binding protein P